jgi:hypothetical protein
MTDFERWQQQLAADEAAALAGTSTQDGAPAPLCAEDQAVHDLWAGYCLETLLAEAAAQPETPPQAQSPLSFKRNVMPTESVEEAYQQLLGIADELIEELTIRQWDSSKDFVETHIANVRTAHDSRKMEGLAASVAQGLGKFKTGLEMLAGNATKTKSVVADVGELFLLTALSAHHLRYALSHAYDC